jgi:hypothetical protein
VYQRHEKQVPINKLCDNNVMTTNQSKGINREIDVPKWLHELHGERTRLSTLVMVYAAALLCGGLTAWQLALTGLSGWKVALAALLLLDVGGGVVANLSSSTSLYYQQNPKLRLPFIAMHVVHPAALAALFPQSWMYFVFVMVFTLGGTYAVNALRDRELQQNLAALLVVVGSALSFLFPQAIPVLYLFSPLFMVKLILGFAVRRAALESETQLQQTLIP